MKYARKTHALARLVLSIPLVLFLAQACLAQDTTGIDFTDASWPAVQARALAEDKPVFLFVYTTFCHYCREMDETVFPQPDVADYYNRTFINYRIAIDDDASGEAVGDSLGVTSFPTYVYFAPDGSRLHQSKGFKPGTDFIQDGQDAFDPQRALFALMQRYNGGDRSPEFLYRYAVALNGYVHPASPVEEVSAAYLATQSEDELRTERNLRFIFDRALNQGEAASAYLLRHAALFVPVFGEEEVTYATRKMIRSGANAAGRAGDTLAYRELREVIARYFSDREQVLGLAEINYHMGATDWSAYAAATLAYLRGVGAGDWRTGSEAGQYLHAFAEESTTLATAADIMAEVVATEANSANLMVYARLLHRSGETARAIIAAELAVTAVGAGESSDDAAALLAELRGE